MLKGKSSRLALLSLVALTGLSVAYASRATWYQRFLKSGAMIWLLETDGTVTQTGSHKFGNDESSPSLPTTNNAANFSMKVPFYNGAGASTARGSVIIASATTNNAFYGSMLTGIATPSIATTTVLGIADGVYASGSVGYMSIAGYALVLTTGTIGIGDTIISSATTAGYAAKELQAVTTAQCLIGIAVSSGNAAGGLTAILLKGR